MLHSHKNQDTLYILNPESIVSGVVENMRGERNYSSDLPVRIIVCVVCDKNILSYTVESLGRRCENILTYTSLKATT